jgi:hypothetical protein
VAEKIGKYFGVENVSRKFAPAARGKTRGPARRGKGKSQNLEAPPTAQKSSLECLRKERASAATRSSIGKRPKARISHPSPRLARGFSFAETGAQENFYEPSAPDKMPATDITARVIGMQRSKIGRYSITTSARSSSGSGKVIRVP